MTDLPSSLGIEAVECLSEGGRSLTVRVTGRWRRRRPELRGQPMLVVETEAGRQRFLAMPEPPSLTGAAPGTWRMSFSVPVALAPVLPGRTFLQLGGVMVPLPIGEVTIAGEVPDSPDLDVLDARRARGSELAAETARRRAAELAAELDRVERLLDEARADADRLRETIADRERRLRGAEQHAHAERALRSELEQELSRRTRAAQHDLRALHDRVADLERELTRMRRAVDEAGHLAAAAEAGRAEAERRLAGAEPSAASPPSSRRSERTRRELELYRAAPSPAPSVRRHHPAQRPGDRVALGREAAMAGPRGGAARADAERIAALEAELAAAREEVETQRRRSARAYEAIDLVRGELRQLRATAASNPAPPPNPAPAPTQDPAPAPRPAEPVQPERLSEALVRLRERTPPAEPAPVELATLDPAKPARAVRPWLHAGFRRLAAEDPRAAGRLLLGLLPAQRAADPRPVAYDLLLSGILVAHVTVDSRAVHVEHDATARRLSEVDFQVVGDLAGVARLLRSGWIRRRWPIPPWRIARVRGDRSQLSRLDRLIAAPLTLRELHAAGVRLDPGLAFTLAGLVIEPAWTAGERFIIAHRGPAAASPGAFLHVRDGRPPLASAEPPQGPVATVIVSPEDELVGALGGATGVQVVGEERPLALLRQWLDRAQSG